MVTTLADAGPGSLRACVQATGPRTCIFRVGGTIQLKRPLAIAKGHGRISILGQTAPGDGIALTLGPRSESQVRTPFYIKDTSDVIVRHLRVRPQFPASTGNVDAFTIENSSLVYLDHVSGAWATDENVSTHLNADRITIAYSIFGEGLQRHSKCALLGSDPTRPQRISFWRNACVSNNDRNPDVNHFAGSCIEIVDNLFYNAGSEWAEVFSQFKGGTPAAFVNNTFKAGPSTGEATLAVKWQEVASVSPPHIFLSGNVVWAPEGKTIDLTDEATAPHLVEDPVCELAVPTSESAHSAYREVRGGAGAFPRDAVDTRLMKEVGSRSKKGSGSLKSEPGPLPLLQAQDPPYADEDEDGIADSREAELGGIVGIFDPWADGDGDGWSMLDTFTEALSREKLSAVP